jgi:hypothetical protein
VKLSDFKGKEAVDVIAKIMVPAFHIMNDETMKDMWSKEHRTVVECCAYALKTHTQYVLDIYEALSKEKRNKATPPKIIALLLDIINDPDLRDLFSLQSQTGISTPSGSATENTEDGEK